MPPKGSREPQGSDKRSQEGPKERSRSTRKVPRIHKSAQDGVRVPQESARRPQEGAKKRVEVPKKRPRSPKMSPQGRKRTPRTLAKTFCGCSGARFGPKGAQESTKKEASRAQEAPKKPQERFKKAQKSPKRVLERQIHTFARVLGVQGPTQG